MPYYDVRILTITDDDGLDVPAVPPAVTVANDNPVERAVPSRPQTWALLADAGVMNMKSGAVVPTVGDALLYSFVYDTAALAELSTSTM